MPPRARAAGRRALVGLFLGLLAAGCAASKEARIRMGLVDLGLPEQQAACMARDMAPRVSAAQLRRLQEALRLSPDEAARLGPRAALERLRVLEDPALVEIAVRAGLACLIRG